MKIRYRCKRDLSWGGKDYAAGEYLESLGFPEGLTREDVIASGKAKEKPEGAQYATRRMAAEPVAETKKPKKTRRKAAEGENQD